MYTLGLKIFQMVRISANTNATSLAKKIDVFKRDPSAIVDAINTAIKMRLPDLSIKIAVRKSGRKTSDTFTPGDPIQDPRDYIPIFVDYGVQDPKYKELLEGIAAKRLKDAGYQNKTIRAYLTHQRDEEDVKDQELDNELAALWASGNRHGTEPSIY